MQSFLRIAREQFTTNSKQLVLSIGNEAGDLDTIVSSISAAWLFNKETNKTTVPVLPFRRDEFRLRQDAAHLFKLAGLAHSDVDGSLDDVVYWDDVLEHTDLLSRQDTEIILTDHNKVTHLVQEKFPAAKVVAVFDHHKDEMLFQDVEHRYLDPGCGSACSLIGERMLALELDVPQDLLCLLIGTILVDSRNFNVKEHRFNDRDEKVFAQLLAKYKTPVNQQALFDSLLGARFDVSHLSSLDLMKLDFKRSTTVLPETGATLEVGFAAIFDTVPGFVDRAGGEDNLKRDMEAFSGQLGLDLLFCQTKCDASTNTKGLVVHYDDDVKLGAFADGIINHIQGAPKTLPQNLLELPLFTRQGISETGFQLKPHEQTNSVMGYHLAPEITRKTFLPAVLSYGKK